MSELNANLMKKLTALVLITSAFMQVGLAQLSNLRLGLNVRPAMTWLSSNDDLINRTGSNAAIGIGFTGEYYLTENLAFTGGIGLNFNGGGTLQHEDGGNFWINSELSDDRLNTGDKPLPDRVKLQYKLQYLEIPMSIKLRTEEKGYLRYYGELPILTIGMNTQARGDLEGEEIASNGENIGPDVNFFNVQLGLGGGIEYAISPSISLVGGLYFHAGLVDVTNNDGISAANYPDQAPSNPNDDYILRPEDSRNRLSCVTLRFAIMF